MQPERSRPPGSDPYWLCLRLTLCNNIILDNDMIIASLLRFVNAYCALPRKTRLDKSRFRKEMDMLGQITARDNLILVLQKDCYCSYPAYFTRAGASIPILSGPPYSPFAVFLMLFPD